LFLGEDSLHSVSELLTPGEFCKGWQTPKNCSYPQTLILQFMGVVRLNRLEFLSHQTKIASKIEISSYAPEDTKSGNLPKPDQLDELNFKRIGYVSLKDNEESGFTSRELKSIDLNIWVFYLKLVFYKNHVNSYNPWNQIGIIEINCISNSLLEYSSKNKHTNNEIVKEIEFDEITKQKLIMLDAIKKTALENEDFDKAQSIKIAIAKLKDLGKQLAFLELKKREAIKNEDYPSAKIISTEIKRLRESVIPSDIDLMTENNEKNKINQNSKEPAKAIPLTEDIILKDTTDPSPKENVKEEKKGKFFYSNYKNRIRKNPQNAYKTIRRRR